MKKFDGIIFYLVLLASGGGGGGGGGSKKSNFKKKDAHKKSDPCLVKSCGTTGMPRLTSTSKSRIFRGGNRPSLVGENKGV